MKIKHLIPIFLLLSVFTFSSCDLFDNVDDVTFDVVLPLDFAIDVNQQSDGPVNYSETKLLDVTSNPDIEEYASKIKEIKVNKITYVISNANANGVTFSNGSVVVNSTNQEIASISQASIANTAEIELTANTAGLNALGASLQNSNQETVKFQGTFSSTPVAFQVKVRFYVSVTADAL